MSSSSVAEQVVSAVGWGAGIPTGIGAIGWVALNNFSPIVLTWAVLAFLALIGLLIMLTFLLKEGSSKIKWGFLAAIALFVFVVLLVTSLSALARERQGGSIILHVWKGDSLPERVEAVRDFPEILGILRQPIELKLNVNPDGSHTYHSGDLRMGEWRVVPIPGYQTQIILITSNKPKFEDDIVFSRILDGRPDVPPTQEEVPPQPNGPRTDSVAKPVADMGRKPVERGQPSASVRVPGPTSTETSLARESRPETPVEPMESEESVSSEDVNTFLEIPEKVQAPALYAKARRNSDICLEQGDLAAAAQELTDFIERFPYTAEAEKARQRRAEILRKGGGDSGH